MRAMSTDPPELSPSSKPGTSSPRDEGEVRDQIEANRAKLRDLTKEMDQEAEDSMQRQSEKDDE